MRASALRPDLPALAHVATPALIVDAAALAANIERMAAFARERRVQLRPHAKTHKSPDIARMQRAAGAVGVACATILEAEALAAAGVERLLVTSPVVGAEKAGRLIALHRKSPLAVVADHPGQVEALLSALEPGDPPLDVLVDVDIGQGRTGVANVQDGVVLARLIARDPRLAFAGLQGYAGHAQHIVDAAERQAEAARGAPVLRALAAALSSDGLRCRIVSGSGTGAHEFDANGPYTELQVGSYVFMDADYGRIRRADGARLPFAPALFVLATVVSANRPGQITVDAGTKALAVNGPPPDRFIGLPENAVYAFGGDEHGIITLPSGCAPPPIGVRVLIGATHCDPTVNLHPAYYAVYPSGDISVWPIVGRYRVG